MPFILIKFIFIFVNDIDHLVALLGCDTLHRFFINSPWRENDSMTCFQG